MRGLLVYRLNKTPCDAVESSSQRSELLFYSQCFNCPRRRGFDPAVVAKKGKRTLLGHGAFASVYKMEYRWPNGIKQTMAVKVLQKGLLRDANKAEDLAYEVRILSGCSSPGVVQFLGWGVLGAEAAAAETMALGDLLEADAEPFLAQEYLEGGTLKVGAGDPDLCPARRQRALRGLFLPYSGGYITLSFRFLP